MTAVVGTVFVYQNEDALQASGLLFPRLGLFIKCLIGIAGIGLVALGTGTIDRTFENAVAAGRARFDPLRVIRGEYHAFFSEFGGSCGMNEWDNTSHVRSFQRCRRNGSTSCQRRSLSSC